MDVDRILRKLAEGRPELALLLYPHVEEDPTEGLDQVEDLNRRALMLLWSSTGRRYRFGVEAADLLGAGPGDPPTLADACFAWVDRAAESTASLYASAALAQESGEECPAQRDKRYVQALMALLSAPALDRAPEREGIFFAARLLARHQGAQSVQPRHLLTAVDAALTYPIMGLLREGGLDAAVLLERTVDLQDTLGPIALLRLREALYWGPRYVSAPDHQLLALTCPLPLRECDGTSGIDARWVARRWFEGPGAARADRLAQGPPDRPTRGVRLLARSAEDWPGLVAAALECCGYSALDPGLTVRDVVCSTDSEARQTPPSIRFDPIPTAPPDLDVPLPDEPPGDLSAGPSYADIRARLGERVVGHEELLDELALVAYYHGRPHAPRARVLLLGSPGIGKTHVARALAEVIGSFSYTVDATDLSETSYKGMNISDMMQAMWHAAGESVERLEGGVLVLDEFDKLRTPSEAAGAGRSSTQLEKALGCQRCTLSLLSGATPVSFGSGMRDGDLQASTARMLIVMTGVGDPSWTSAPSAEALVRFGYMRELVERITDRYYLRPLGVEGVIRLLATGAESAMQTLGQLCRLEGYALEISPEAYRYAAGALVEGWGGAGPRTANGWLVAAARRRLRMALEAQLAPGSRIRVEADDLSIPRIQGPPAEPRWR